METTLDLTMSRTDIESVLSLVAQSDASDVSEPSNLDASRALNCGLSPEMVKDAFVFVTVVFGTAKAALEFLKTLREYVKAKGAAIGVAEAATGKSLGQVDASTQDATLARMAQS